jgi:hypothetical protein
MATKKMYWSKETTIFGTSVWMGTKDKSINLKVADNLEFNPISKLSPKLKTGYLFRSPNIDPDYLQSVFETLEQITNGINIWVELDQKTEKYTAYACLEDRYDANMFAFAQVEVFQKWSEEKQAAAKVEAKRKPQKVKINKDGTVTIKVTSTTLADDPQDINRVG